MISEPVDKTPPMLEFTGERFVPEIEGNVALEHLHRYLIARELASGKVVLDVACGEGYGSAMLAEVGSRVVGVDISAETVAHARRRYTIENLEFYEGRADAVPLSEGSVDLVVSFETIEHHDQHTNMMAEIRRVLRPGGLLIMSSPDKHEYSDVPAYSNPFHVKELYLEEFESLLGRHFQNVAISGQRICYGSVVASDRLNGVFSSFVEQDCTFTRKAGIPRPIYFVAVASDAPLPTLGTSFYEVNIELHDCQVAALNQQIAALNQQVAALNQMVEVRDQQLRALWESTIWRVTKPLRSISSALRCLLRR